MLTIIILVKLLNRAKVQSSLKHKTRTVNKVKGSSANKITLCYGRNKPNFGESLVRQTADPENTKTLKYQKINNAKFGI